MHMNIMCYFYIYHIVSIAPGFTKIAAIILLSLGPTAVAKSSGEICSTCKERIFGAAENVHSPTEGATV